MSESEQPPRRGHRIGLVLAALIGSMLVAWLAIRPTRVEVTRLRTREVVQTVAASGRVLAAASVQLRAQAAGTVVEVACDLGAEVLPEQLLVRLDDREARAAFEQAEARLAQSAAQLRQVRRVTARGADETLRRADVELDQARRELARVEQLVRAGASPPSGLDDARYALSLATSRRALAAIDAAASSPAGSAVQLAMASVLEAQGALRAAEARLSYTRLRALVRAAVTGCKVEVGDSVQTGDVLVTLVREGPIRLAMEPDERNLALLRVGQRARASAEAFPDHRFEARLSAIAPAIDLARGTVEVRFEVPSPPPFLRADMTVSIETEVARKPAARVVPSAVVRDLGGSEPFVLVVDNGRAMQRALRLGARDASWVEVLEGLGPADAVVVDAAVAPGQRVRGKGE